MASIAMTVNEKRVTVESEADRTLLDVLREELKLCGTKYGCGEGSCGACTVLLDGKRAFACQTAVGDIDSRKVQTIEGLANGDTLHRVQQAFLDENAFQCGYCTAGMIMSAAALLSENPRPSREETVAWMNRNICRCCSYASILRAVRRATGEEVLR